MSTTDEAAKSWYSKIESYDFETNALKPDTDNEALKFTQLIWKSSTTVGFGIKDSVVVAWFCPEGNQPDDPEVFKSNVCPKGGCVDEVGS